LAIRLADTLLSKPLSNSALNQIKEYSGDIEGKKTAVAGHNEHYKTTFPAL
jgi:hypothetical protein